MVRAIAHAGAVLGLFSPERPEWGATSVAGALGWSKSGAHDMLASLASIGLLRRSDHGRYRLGWQALEMAETLGATDQVVVKAAPVMRDLLRTGRHPVALPPG